TGISAIAIGGTTLHSFLGIELGTGSVDDLVKKIKRKSKATQNWLTLDVLVIDEVSMLSSELFEKLENIGRILKCAIPHRLLGNQPQIPDPPFGGIQLVLSGDFLQLPVIGDESKFCFQSEVWKK